MKVLRSLPFIYGIHSHNAAVAKPFFWSIDAAMLCRHTFRLLVHHRRHAENISKPTFLPQCTRQMDYIQAIPNDNNLIIVFSLESY